MTKKVNYYGFLTFKLNSVFQDIRGVYLSEEAAKNALIEYLKTNLTHRGEVFQCRVLSDVSLQIETNVSKRGKAAKGKK